jgi:hypothetical protein
MSQFEPPKQAMVGSSLHGLPLSTMVNPILHGKIEKIKNHEEHHGAPGRGLRPTGLGGRVPLLIFYFSSFILV